MIPFGAIDIQVKGLDQLQKIFVNSLVGYINEIIRSSNRLEE